MTIAAVWWSSSSYGLGPGLGDLTVDSTLASPLRASIPLRGMAEIDLDAELFFVTIESDARARIEYRIERQDADTADLILFTREPISEPLFQFRVEVEWDRSSLARSYDVFIDPPVHETQTTIGIAPAPVAIEPASAEVAHTIDAADHNEPEMVVAGLDKTISLPAEQNATTAVVDPAAGSLLQAEASAAKLAIDAPRREYGPTIDGNSIWRVARAVATDLENLNIYQWMYAIWKANPDAFYRGNMHHLNRNALMVIPYASEVAEVNRREAYRVYREQMILLEATQPQSTALIAVVDVESSAPVTTTVTAGSAQELAAPVVADAAARTIAEGSLPAGSLADAGQAEADAPVTELSEAEQLSAVMALIEEIESTEVAIVIPSLAEDTIEPVGEGLVELDLAAAMAQPIAADVAANSIASAQPPLYTDLIQGGVIGEAFEPVPMDVSADAAAPVGADSDLDWISNLLNRQQMIEQMPVIGAQAPLAFLGRFIQWLDELVATSPSWTALAMGFWIALVIFLVGWEFRARHHRAVVITAAADRPVLRSSPQPVMAPVDGAQPVAEPGSTKPDEKVAAPLQNPTLKPIRGDQPDVHAEDILAKADNFMVAKDPAEAVKLLELAIKLQPDQPRFVIRLLEIHHELKQADEFESLVQRVSPWYDELDISDQIHLQVMYVQLRPQATPLIDVEQAVKARARAEADADAVEKARLNGKVDLSTSLVKDNKTDADDDEGYVATQVLNMNDELPGAEEPAEEPEKLAANGEVLDLELMLREVDVYLAYGLYDNAEELLLKGIEADSNRVDYLAKLLDTHFATRNLVDFVTCAETLRAMGEAVNQEYWDAVEVMGYQLAPYNELFAGGKNRSLDGAIDEIAALQPADFDLAADAVADADDGIDAPVALSADELFVSEAEEEVSNADSSAAELVAELMTDNEIDEPDLNLNIDETANINFEGDNPVTIDQYSDDDSAGDERLSLDESGGESDDLVFADDLSFDTMVGGRAQDDDDEVLDLDGLESVAETVVMDNYPDLDAFDNIQLDDDATMKFTMAQGNEAASVKPAADIDDDIKTSEFAAARILHFPESGSSGAQSAEFEAEVKMTLQALRDQLQYVTERLFKQERETYELRQSMQETIERGGAKDQRNNKKSS